MAIKDITEEVKMLREKNSLQERIDQLSQERAVFALKALLLAGHVTDASMQATLALAEILKK